MFASPQKIFAAVAVLLLLLPFLLPFSILSAAWWAEAKDFSHFVGFGVLGLTLLSLANWKSNVHLLLAALTAFFLAFSTEVYQMLLQNGRTGDAGDIVSNCLGIVFSALVCFVIYSRQSMRWKVTALLLAGFILAYEASPIMKRVNENSQREAQLPVLYNFKQPWAVANLGTIHAIKNEFVSGDIADLGYSHSFTFPKTTWGGVIAYKVWPHWGNYRTLSVEFFASIVDEKSVLGHVVLEIVTDTWQINPQWVSVDIEILPGPNKINIPLREFAVGDEPIVFKDTRVQYVEIAKSKSTNLVTIALDRIQLVE